MTRRTSALAVAALLAACAGADAPAPAADPVERTLDEAGLAALPLRTLDTLAQVCLADGYGDCPLQAAFVNALDRGHLVLWEPQRRPLRLAPDGSVTPVEGPFATRGAASIAADGRGLVAVMMDSGWTVVRVAADGRVTDRDTLAHLDAWAATGFVGALPVMQRITDRQSGDGARFAVSRLGRITDTAGTVLFETRIPWLRMTDQGQLPPPLFAAFPSYDVADDGAVAWSPSDRFEVEFRDARGAVRWRLRGPAGPVVTDAELDAREVEVREAFAAMPYAEEDFARMRGEAPATHPAVTALAVLPDGGVLVGGARPPAADSVAWLRVAADGTPQDRFRLPAAARLLHATGDSLLLHLPTEGEPWEVRWFRLGGVTP